MQCHLRLVYICDNIVKFKKKVKKKYLLLSTLSDRLIKERQEGTDFSLSKTYVRERVVVACA